jgi:signal transduction histidine kinase
MRAVLPARPERGVPSLLTQAVVIPATLSALVALVLVGEVRALVSLSGWVQHTDEVIDSAHHVEQILIERESAFRGYMNVPRDEFLAPYTRTTKSIAQSWDSLVRLTADNPPQQARLRAVEPLWKEWEAFVARCLELRRSGKDHAGRELEATGYGRERMEGLRAGLLEFIKVEEGLRDMRTANERTWASRIIGGSVAMLLLLGILLGLIARRQMRQVVRGYSGALNAAEQAMAQREEFLTIAAHELRTPLTSLQLDLQRICRQMNNERPGPLLSEQLATALRQTRRLGALIESLLDASALAGNAQLELHREQMDLMDVVFAAVARVRGEIGQGGYPIDVQGESATGLWDRARLEPVITTLLRNACKYGEGKPVRVSVRRDGDDRVVSVADEGIGIPADRQQSIFGRFGRAVSPRAYGGLGLNLYVAQRLAEAHGGRIDVRSEEGKGATFVVRLPARPVEDELQRTA